MQIRNLEFTRPDSRARVSATVKWEDSGYGEREVFFETDACFSDSLAQDAGAFLLAAIIPAMQFDERRIRIEGHVCPQLRDGLYTAIRQLRHWYGVGNDNLTIEASQGFRPSRVPDKHQTACCMSGGIDSLASFRRNRVNLPLDHPGSVKDLLFIHGFEVGGSRKHDANHESYASDREMLSEFARLQNAELIPVYTNIRFLEEDAPGIYYTNLFVMQSFAACLAACAHVLGNRLTNLLIPSSHEISGLEPLGSHPLLDPSYSSASLNVAHDGLLYSRFDKMRLLADWPASLEVLRVCADPLRPKGKINCGKCEKCVRTRVSLLVLNVLDKCPTFEGNDVMAEDIDRLWITQPGPDSSTYGYLGYGSNHFWEMMMNEVIKMGRMDLASAIERKLVEYRQVLKKQAWIKRIKRYDQQFLGGTIGRTRRLLRGGHGKQALE